MIKNPRLGDIVYYIELTEIKSAMVLGIQIQYSDFVDFINNKPHGSVTLGEAYSGDGCKTFDTFKIFNIMDVRDVYASEAAAKRMYNLKIGHVLKRNKK